MPARTRRTDFHEWTPTKTLHLHKSERSDPKTQIPLDLNDTHLARYSVKPLESLHRQRQTFKMSLRDLATTACDAGSSSSSNPLTTLSNALLPQSAQAHALAQQQHQQQEHLPPGMTHEEAILHRLEIPLHARPPVAPPLPPPPRPPPRLADAFARQHPWQRPFPPLPPPAHGAATDAFERAFRTAGKQPVAPVPYHPISNMRSQMYTSRASEVMRHMEALSMSGNPPVDLMRGRGCGVKDKTQSMSASQVMEKVEDSVFGVKDETQDVQASDARSWGDEFTSFENSDVGVVALENLDDYDRFVFDDTVEGAFQQWLRRDDMQQYRYTERERDSSKSAEEALEEGIKHREAGRLTKAVECFEDALNRPEGEGLTKDRRATAWYLLGVTHAETDDDTRAIQALRQGLSEWSGKAIGERRGDNPHIWQSLIALAVSYTNELELGKALLHMKEWFELWEGRHSGDPEGGMSGAVSKGEMEGADALERRLNTAAAQNPRDVDLFVVLGILHNLDREYNTAADAFRHAVMLRPEDPNLWNKLGATLANGGNSDDALRAYRKAVDINPCLIRAWVNVGTAYANRSEYPKATRYYLKAISMAEEQAEKDDDRMSHVWGYLRTSLISLERPEILHLVDERNLEGLRSHFSF